PLPVADTGQHITERISHRHRTAPSYQLDLTTPGNAPDDARSRRALRHSLNLRCTPRGRPVSSQRLRTRVGLALRGISASFSRAWNCSSGLNVRSLAIAFNRARLAADFLAMSFRLL